MRGLLRNINQDGNKLTCEIHGSVSIANALRRSLIDYTTSYAVDSVVFEHNTTCMPDEYIAHRIGMIPFEKSSSTEYKHAQIDVSGRNVMSQDIKGADAAHSNIPIINMLETQRLRCTLKFRKSSGIEHSRFCQAAAVGYRLEGDIAYISFETINGERPIVLLNDAVNALRHRMKSLQIS